MEEKFMKEALKQAKKAAVMNNYEFVMAEYEYQMIRKGSADTFIKNFGCQSVKLQSVRL